MAAEVHPVSVRPVAVKAVVASVHHVVAKVVAVSVRADPHLVNNYFINKLSQIPLALACGIFLPHLNRALGHRNGVSLRFSRFVIFLHKGRHHWFLTIALDQLPVCFDKLLSPIEVVCQR